MMAFRHTFVGGALVALLFAAPSPGSVIFVRAGDDLQAALDRAAPGDVIQLEAGVTFTGNFVLPAKPDGPSITVRSSTPASRLPGPGTRIKPADAHLLPKIRTATAAPALRTAPGAANWRLETLELAGSGGNDILSLGDGSRAQASEIVIPRDLVVDRCYIHGDAVAGQKRGIALNARAVTIINSWIADIKKAGQDTQAIAAWNGPGPFTILNNYLEAAGEVVLFGGADPAIDRLVPSRIIFRGNHVTRPLAWRDSAFQIKNLLEMKNARRVVVEANVFENNWQAAQAGYAILMTPRNQDGGAPWSVVEEVDFRLNLVRHVAAAFNILGADSPNPSGQARAIRIIGNLVHDVDGSEWGGNGAFLLLGDGPRDIVVANNTVLQSGNVVSAYGGPPDRPTPIFDFTFRDNIVRHNRYGIHGADHGVGNDTIDAYFPGATITRNVMAGGPSYAYPPGNFFPPGEELESQFVDASSGDYRLVSGSPYARSGTSGGAIGADVALVRKLAGFALEGRLIVSREKPF